MLLEESVEAIQIGAQAAFTRQFRCQCGWETKGIKEPKDRFATQNRLTPQTQSLLQFLKLTQTSPQRPPKTFFLPRQFVQDGCLPLYQFRVDRSIARDDSLSHFSSESAWQTQLMSTAYCTPNQPTADIALF